MNLRESTPMMMMVHSEASNDVALTTRTKLCQPGHTIGSNELHHCEEKAHDDVVNGKMVSILQQQDVKASSLHPSPCHHHIIQPKDILVFLIMVLFISLSQYGLGHYVMRRNEFTLMEYTAACFVSVSALIGGFQFYFKAQQLALSTFSKSEYFNVDCFVDRYIPFIPHSIYLYSFGDLFIMACIIPTSPTMNQLIHILFGLLIVTLCQCLIFVTFPSNVPAHYRMELKKYEEKYGKLDRMTKYLFEMMHQMDHDTNTVPSGHCSIATYLSITQWHIFGVFTLLNPLLIACSCVMTKQHAFMDTVLGILFGFVIYAVVNVNTIF